MGNHIHQNQLLFVLHYSLNLPLHSQAHKSSSSLFCKNSLGYYRKFASFTYKNNGPEFQLWSLCFIDYCILVYAGDSFYSTSSLIPSFPQPNVPLSLPSHSQHRPPPLGLSNLFNSIHNLKYQFWWKKGSNSIDFIFD